MLISALEGRKDWAQLVAATICPVCGSHAATCRNLGATPGTLAASSPRNDWHQERKILAAENFEKKSQQPPPKPVPDPVVPQTVSSVVPPVNIAVDSKPASQIPEGYPDGERE
jgi:hypothetical protein